MSKLEIRDLVLELGDKIFGLDGEVSGEAQKIIENMKEELFKLIKIEKVD